MKILEAIWFTMLSSLCLYIGAMHDQPPFVLLGMVFMAVGICNWLETT